VSGESISNHYLLIFAVIALGLMATDVRAEVCKGWCPHKSSYAHYMAEGRFQERASYGTTLSFSCDNGMLWKELEGFNWEWAIASTSSATLSEVKEIQKEIDHDAEANGSPIDWNKMITFHQNCGGVFQLIIIEGK